MQNAGILISSAGRRVGLLECVRDSVARYGPGTPVITVDSGLSAPATFCSDHTEIVPRCLDPDFVPAVMEICRRHRIELIIPTIDTELPVYAAAREAFAAIGTRVSISTPAVVEICACKEATNRWLFENGFPAVRQTNIFSALSHPEYWPFPLIAKPVRGSASIGVKVVRSRLELEALQSAADKYVLEEIAQGREFTINVFVNRCGECVCAVPHWRMEIRAGEVSKAITVREPRLIQLGRLIAEALPGAYGALNIQCFMDEAGRVRVFEINSRFGGGYPLAHYAGARFTDWLLDELQGRLVARFDAWTDDLAMLRYDDAVFVPGFKVRECNLESAPSSTSTTHCFLNGTTFAAASKR